MQDDKWSFWKDEAKLSLLTSENRVKALLAILAGLLVSGIVGITGTYVGMSNLQSWLTSIVVALILLPASVATEMLFKGKAAAERLKANCDLLTAERDALNVRKTRRGDRNDVIKRFRGLIEAGQKINPQTVADFECWYNDMSLCVSECLDEPCAKQVLQQVAETTQVQDSGDTEKAKRLMAAYIDKLREWDAGLRGGRVDHCIREFYVIVSE